MSSRSADRAHPTPQLSDSEFYFLLNVKKLCITIKMTDIEQQMQEKLKWCIIVLFASLPFSHSLNLH